MMKKRDSRRTDVVIDWQPDGKQRMINTLERVAVLRSALGPESEGISGRLTTPGIMSVSFCVRKGLGVHTRLGTRGLN